MAEHPSNHEAGRLALERSLAQLGCEITRWRGMLASVRRGNERFHVSLDVVAALLERPFDELGDAELTLLMGDLLGLPVDHELLLDLEVVRPLLRPRLVNVRELEGPGRAMCRRELMGDLLTAVSVGCATRRAWVTSRLLDAWNLEFEDVMMLARDNLRSTINTSHVVDCQGAPGLLAVADEREPAAASILIIDELLPGIRADPGIVWSAPGDETLLLLPVDEQAGVEGLLALIQATYAMAQEQDASLSEQVFWTRGDLTERLPLIWVEEEGERRVRLEADEGIVENLLGRLGDEGGAAEEDDDEDDDEGGEVLSE